MRPDSKLLALMLASAVWVGCSASGGGSKHGSTGGGTENPEDDGTDGPADGKDKTKKNTCLAGFNVINGAETSAYPSVGLIAELDPQNVIGGTCSGTWVGPNTMITAAHCITAGSETELVYLKGSTVSTGATIQEAKKIVASGIKPKKVVINAEELKHGNLENGQIKMDVAYKDMAILIFGSDVAPATTKLLDREPKDHEAAVIVGFGATSSSVTSAEPGEKSIKRVGKNHVVVRADLQDAFPDVLIMFGRGETKDTSGKAIDSLSGAGDSGGPIFIDGALAGVVSNGASDDPGSNFYEISKLAKEVGEGSESDMTVYSSLNSNFAKNLLEKAKAAGAKFAYGSGADSTQPSTGSGGDQPVCLTDTLEEAPSDP